MVFVPAVFRKINLLTVEPKWKVLSATFKNFSSSTGYSREEIEKFRKTFRTMPSYEESIDATKDLIPYLQAINYNRSMESYHLHIAFIQKMFGGRIEMTQIMKYIGNHHDPILLMNEYVDTFDQKKDGYILREDFVMGIEDAKAHDPRIKNVSYEQFLKDVSTSKDGRISVSECKDWFSKNLVVA